MMSQENITRQILEVEADSRRSMSRARGRWFDYIHIHCWSHMGIQPENQMTVAFDWTTWQTFLASLTTRLSQEKSEQMKINRKIGILIEHLLALNIKYRFDFSA